MIGAGLGLKKKSNRVGWSEAENLPMPEEESEGVTITASKEMEVESKKEPEPEAGEAQIDEKPRGKQHPKKQ